MKLVFSLPPTTNHIYGITAMGGHARMYVTKDGKDWFEKAGYEILKQHRKRTPIETKCEIWIQIHVSSDRDVDGSAKPILDVLQKSGVVKNDKLFYKMDIERFKCARGEEKVEVEILGY